MIFTNTTEYAIRGMSELACRSTNGHTVLLDQLVAGTTLPRDFLAKIFQRLVRAKLLTSAKGRGGGFALARPAHDITLMDIVEAIEGSKPLDGCATALRLSHHLHDTREQGFRADAFRSHYKGPGGIDGRTNDFAVRFLLHWNRFARDH